MAIAKLITVDIATTKSGALRATSEDIVGLHVVAKDETTLKAQVCGMLTDLFAAQGQLVCVYESEPKTQDAPPPWVIVPKNNDRVAC